MRSSRQQKVRRNKTRWPLENWPMNVLFSRAVEEPLKTGDSRMNYPNVQLFIDGKWRPAASGKTIPVLNPATEESLGTVAHAGKADLDEALAAAEKGFKAWRAVSAYERSKVMRKAADLMRERAEGIATLMTMEQGKVLTEARIETMASADIIEWFAEEGRRTY